MTASERKHVLAGQHGSRSTRTVKPERVVFHLLREKRIPREVGPQALVVSNSLFVVLFRQEIRQLRVELVAHHAAFGRLSTFMKLSQ